MSDSWYTQQYNALRNAQISQQQLDDINYRDYINTQTEAIKARAQENILEKEALKKAILADQAASNAQNVQWMNARDLERRAAIAQKYSTIEIPLGNSRVISTISQETSGALVPYKAPKGNTASGAQTATALSTSRVIDVDFSDVASNKNPPISKQSPLNPVPNPSERLPTPASGAPVASTLGKVANGLSTVGGAITLAQSVGNLVKEPSVGGGLTTAGALLLLAPNPYAKGAGLGLLALGTIADILNFGKKPTASNAVISKNSSPVSNSLPLQGLTNGTGYNVVIDGAVTTVDGEILGFINNQTFASVTAPVRQLEIVATSNSLILVINDAGGSRNILISSTGANQRALQNNLSISLQTIAGQPVPPSSPANTPYIPSSAVIPPSDTPSGGVWDVLDYGEKYKQGTATADRVATPNARTAPSEAVTPNRSQTPIAPTPATPVNPKEKKPDRTGDAKSAPNNTTGVSSVTGAPTANAGGTFLEKPAFTARPYVSGVSDPSEAYDPKDVTTGLTRSQMEKAYADQQKAVQTASQANQMAAIEKDAQGIVRTINNLSTVPRQDLGGLSDRDYQIQAYRNTMAGDPVRVDAFNRALAASQVTTKPTSTPIIPSPVTTPSPSPSPSPSPVEAPNNQTGLVLGSIAAIAATVTALKLGSDLLVNNSLANTPKIDQIAQNTTNTNQQTNAKQGVCDAMQPQQCGFEGVKQATTEATNPIKDIATSNNGLLANLLTLLNNVWTFLQNNLGKVLQLLNNQVVDRTLAVMNLATNIHNAALLTRDIGETLGSVVDNVISLTPLRFTNSEGSQVQFTDFIGTNFRAFLIQVLGAERYVELTLNWQKASMILNSAAQVLNTTQSMLDPISSAVEYGMENVSKIGNSLKEDGVVSENAYPAMDETIRARRVNRFERLNDTLEGAENIASNLSSVTSSAVSIKEDYKQLREDAKDLKDKANAFNAADSEARAALKAELPTEITPITLAPAPAEDEEP